MSWQASTPPSSTAVTSTAGPERTHDFARRESCASAVPALYLEMSNLTCDSAALRAVVAAHRDALDEILERGSATNPRLLHMRLDSASKLPTGRIDLVADLRSAR